MAPMNKNKYNFSYTGFSLRIPEMLKMAKSIYHKSDFDYINELGNGKATTAKKFRNEINKRLKTLTDEQLEVFVNGGLTAQTQIGFLAICKVHGYIRDLMIELIREKYLLFDTIITDGDYISFFRQKAEHHPEMATLTEKTANKIQQVTLRILEQAGIINNPKDKIIQPILLEEDVIRSVVNDNSSWLKIFMVSDMDIENWEKQYGRHH